MHRMGLSAWIRAAKAARQLKLAHREVGSQMLRTGYSIAFTRLITPGAMAITISR